jgi:hypothetical protein
MQQPLIGNSSVDTLKYFGAIFNKRITWKLHIEMTEAKAFRTFIRLYYLFKSEHVSTNIKLTLHKELRSVMTYASPAWESAAETHLSKLQRLQTRFSAPLAIFQGAHRFANCTRLSIFRTCTIS